MATKQHTVELTDAERQQLRDLTCRGTAAARRIRRARILLLAADGLADRLVELGCVDRISDETVRRTLKNTTSSPGRSRNGACPS